MTFHSHARSYTHAPPPPPRKILMNTSKLCQHKEVTHDIVFGHWLYSKGNSQPTSFVERLPWFYQGGRPVRIPDPPPPLQTPPKFSNPSFSNLRFWGKGSAPRRRIFFFCPS